LLLLEPKIIEEPDITKPYPEGYRPSIDVKLPDGNVHNLSELTIIDYIKSLCESKKISIELDYRRAGIQDSKPVSIVGLETINQLSSETGTRIDPRAFRENFYVDW